MTFELRHVIQQYIYIWLWYDRAHVYRVPGTYLENNFFGGGLSETLSSSYLFWRDETSTTRTLLKTEI